jgi:hypothetical protein
MAALPALQKLFKLIRPTFASYFLQGNMKQHMLTHKIRDMFGSSNNSGDETSQTAQSPSSSTSDQPQINFAIKLEKSQSPDFIAAESGKNKENRMESETSSQTSSGSANNNYNQYINKDNDIKKWCQKLNEMPENIAAS